MRLEWRVPGADVNPYLAVAGVISNSQYSRRRPRPAATGDAYQQEARPFPQHLGLAAEEFLVSAFMEEKFGAAVARHYG